MRCLLRDLKTVFFGMGAQLSQSEFEPDAAFTGIHYFWQNEIALGRCVTNRRSEEVVVG